MDDTTQDNRFAPPRAAVADVHDEEAATAVLASRAARLGAGLVDMLVCLVIYFAVLLPLYGLNAFRPEFHARIRPGLAIYYVLTYAMEAWLLYQFSQSVGKLAIGLRIVRPDGSRATFGRTFVLRTLVIGALAFIPWIGMLLVLLDCIFIFGPSRRCVHDYLADTIVVTAASSANAIRMAGA